jgi:hypothetical protein
VLDKDKTPAERPSVSRAKGSKSKADLEFAFQLTLRLLLEKN